MSLPPTPLPYRDEKPRGAADFYFAIHATFRFIERKFGINGLRAYWTDLGERYMEPVWTKWRSGGLSAVAAYWRAFFNAEPGGNVSVEESAEAVTIRVETCPAIAHLRKSGREILPEFCQHCYYVSEAAAAKAELTVRVCGGAGSCVQTFYPRAEAPPPQTLWEIRRNEPTGASSIRNSPSKSQN